MLRDMQASFSSARVRIVQVGNIETDVYLTWIEGCFQVSRSGIFSFAFSLARQGNFPQCVGIPGRNECLRTTRILPPPIPSRLSLCGSHRCVCR